MGGGGGVEILRYYRVRLFSMRPLAHHLILGSQAHTQPSDAPSVIEGSWEEWGCLPKGHKETSGADGYIHNMTAVVGLGGGGRQQRQSIEENEDPGEPSPVT